MVLMCIHTQDFVLRLKRTYSQSGLQRQELVVRPGCNDSLIEQSVDDLGWHVGILAGSAVLISVGQPLFCQEHVHKL